jgi:2'-5' RNA ligase
MKPGPVRTNAIDTGSSLRAFFALPVVEPQRQLLETEIERLSGEAWAKDVRWVRSDGLHVTLRFLGDVDRADVDRLAARVGDEIASLAAFETRLRGVELFPSERKPRVVAAVLVPSEPLHALVRRIDAAVVAHGLAAEPGAFRGHITLGRFRRRPRRPVLLGSTLADMPARAEHVVLYRSVLSREPARYSALLTLPLAPSNVL